ncbi:MAG: hypothetical protein ACOCWW_00475 [Bacteroidota bacterium]
MREINGQNFSEIGELRGAVFELINEITDSKYSATSIREEIRELRNEKSNEMTKEERESLNRQIHSLEEDLANENSHLNYLNTQAGELLNNIENLESNLRKNVGVYEMTLKNDYFGEAFENSVLKENDNLNEIRTLKKQLREKREDAQAVKNSVSTSVHRTYQKKSRGFWSFVWDFLTTPFKAIGNMLSFLLGTGKSNKDVIKDTSGITHNEDETGIFSKTGGATFKYDQSEFSDFNTESSTVSYDKADYYNKSDETGGGKINDFGENCFEEMRTQKIEDINTQGSFWNPSGKYKNYFKGTPETDPLGETRSSKGRSHFNYVFPEHPDSRDPGWHITTQLKGFGKKEGFEDSGLSEHDFIDEMDFDQETPNTKTTVNQESNSSNDWMNSYIDYANPPESNAYAEYENHLSSGNYAAADEAFGRSMGANTEARDWNDIGMAEVDAAISDFWDSDDKDTQSGFDIGGFDASDFGGDTDHDHDADFDSDTDAGNDFDTGVSDGPDADFDSGNDSSSDGDTGDYDSSIL